MLEADDVPESFGVPDRFPPYAEINKRHGDPNRYEHGCYNVVDVLFREHVFWRAFIPLLPDVPVDRYGRYRKRYHPAEADHDQSDFFRHVPVVAQRMEYGDVAVGGDRQEIVNRAGTRQNNEYESQDARGLMFA